MADYLQVKNLTKSYGDIELFSNISFNIAKNQKVALVAQNGAGKSTLLNIITEKLYADGGSSEFAKDIKIGFLEQEPFLEESKSVLENIVLSNSNIFQIIAKYEKAIESNDKKELEQAFIDMDKHNAWDYESNIKKILGVLKIFDLTQLVNTMSGGQKKRVALAREILKDPDFLILDEPTNHLDIDMIEWLEGYLSSSTITLFMVTHDRYFLDRVCNSIYEIDDNTIYHYRGNYSYFIKNRAERISQQNDEVERAKNLLRKEQDWMNRMPKARATKAKSRIDDFYKLKDKASNTRIEVEMNLEFKSSRIGGKIIDIKNISKSFGDLNLISNFSYRFERYEKIGIVGNNGSGKSTLLNILTNKIKPDSGVIEIGTTIKIGYYHQAGIKLDNDKRIIDVITDISESIKINDKLEMSAAQFLNYFLFAYKKHYTHVSKLSGGEKRRLYLLTILMTNPNFLILDEPTNDLDIMTLGVLEKYLVNFQGTLLVVSHDRFFMDNVVDRILFFKGDGSIKEFPGNYSLHREEVIKQEKLKKKNSSKDKKVRVKTEKKKKLSYKEKVEFEKLEGEIEELQKEKDALETEINSGKMSAIDLTESSIRIGKIIELIDTKEFRWLELSEI